MTLREFLKGIADVIREGLGSQADNLLVKPKDFTEKIREAYSFRYDVGYDDGYTNGDAMGYYDGYEEGYGNGWKDGGLDASPQETVSGEAIAIKDISPVEHNMVVKVNGVEDLSTVKLYKCGKNLIPFPIKSTQWTINYYEGYSTEKNGITFTINADGSITTKGTATETVYFNIGKIALDTGEVNTLLGSTTGRAYSECNLSISKYLRWDKGNSLLYYSISKGTVIDEVLYPQIEYGTLTDFEPYIEPTIYDVLPNGTVEGFEYLYPNTTLYTDTSGAVIDCTYYQDGKKVKENLIDMILSLGGVINEE